MKIITLLLLCFVLTGCYAHVDPGHTRVSGGGITVETGDGYGGRGGHCPPGHAKKGWC